MGRKNVSPNAHDPRSWGLLVALLVALAAVLAPAVAHAESTQPMYRLYNQWSGEHLFTTDATEYDRLAGIGWQREGVAWQAPTSGDAVYRLYNPYSGDHHYTKDASEYDRLGSIGWNKEGVAFRSGSSSGTAVYRLFNQWLTQGTHLYTTDEAEYNRLCGLGWSGEGIAFYGTTTGSGGSGSSGGSGGSTSTDTSNPYSYLVGTWTGTLEDSARCPSAYTMTPTVTIKSAGADGVVVADIKACLHDHGYTPDTANDNWAYITGASAVVSRNSYNNKDTISFTGDVSGDYGSKSAFSVKITVTDASLASRQFEVEVTTKGRSGYSYTYKYLMSKAGSTYQASSNPYSYLVGTWTGTLEDSARCPSAQTMTPTITFKSASPDGIVVADVKACLHNHRYDPETSKDVWFNLSDARVVVSRGSYSNKDTLTFRGDPSGTYGSSSEFYVKVTVTDASLASRTMEAEITTRGSSGYSYTYTYKMTKR